MIRKLMSFFDRKFIGRRSFNEMKYMITLAFIFAMIITHQIRYLHHQSFEGHHIRMSQEDESSFEIDAWKEETTTDDGEPESSSSTVSDDENFNHEHANFKHSADEESIDSVKNEKAFSENANVLAQHQATDVEKIYPDAYPLSTLKYDMNGLASPDYLKRKAKGYDNPDEEFYRINDNCTLDKKCYIPADAHILRKTDIDCQQILPLLDEMRECLKEEKEECEHYLNHGYWRDVYKTTYFDEKLQKEYEVVLKVLKIEHVSPASELRQARESILLNYVHESSFVVQELGHCNLHDDPDFSYVTMSFLYPINLQDYLRDPQFDKELTLNQLLKFAVDITEGIHAVHTAKNPFLHFDLQPRQFMLEDLESKKVLINDFNRGKFIPCKDTEDGKCAETCKVCTGANKGPWRAPEEYRKGPIGLEADIYTIGMMYWSMFTKGKRPFHPEVKKSKKVYEMVRDGHREILHESIPPELQELIKQCWEADQSKRPTSKELLAGIKKIQQKYLAQGGEHYSEYTFEVGAQSKEPAWRKPGQDHEKSP